ncbi:helix-turn-helix domain-containing protein [Streptomyces sp. NPDC090029]|uniref:helix-turn-helix domain-containing protein n=1 Tax=Streptomyces sp. NPDC090029 TaxID=3365924 RepID=UPI00382EEB04
MVDVRVLLDTGPTSAEVDRVHAAFRGWDMDATVEGHSYGGPPPTSCFLIVVNTQLPAFLARLTDTDSGVSDLERLVTSLLALRSNPHHWGRPHVVKLEDAQSGLGVICDTEVPSRAYDALLSLDLSHFDRDSPPLQIEWNPALGIWQAKLLGVARRTMLRVPLRPAADEGLPRLRRLNDAEVTELWRLVDPGSDSAITRRRASIVLATAVGWNIASVAQRVAVSENHILAVIHNFNNAGFAALSPDFEGCRVAPTAQETRDAVAVAGRSPGEFGLPGRSWTATTLAEFLVTEGLVEDIGPTAANELMAVAASHLAEVLI